MEHPRSWSGWTQSKSQCLRTVTPGRLASRACPGNRLRMLRKQVASPTNLRRWWNQLARLVSSDTAGTFGCATKSAVAMSCCTERRKAGSSSPGRRTQCLRLTLCRASGSAGLESTVADPVNCIILRDSVPGSTCHDKVYRPRDSRGLSHAGAVAAWSEFGNQAQGRRAPKSPAPGLRHGRLRVS